MAKYPTTATKHDNKNNFAAAIIPVMVSTQILYLALLAYKWPPRRRPGIVRHALIFPLRGGEMNAWRTNPKGWSAGRGGLPTSRAQIFSRTRSASGRFFMVSAAKASERATEPEMRSEGLRECLPRRAMISPLSLLRAMQGVDLSSRPLFSSQDFKLSRFQDIERCVVQDVEMLNRGVHADGTIRRFALEFKAS